MTVDLQKAKSPLGGRQLGTPETVCLREVAFTPLFDLRVEPDTPAFAAVNQALGLTLPTVVGQSTSVGNGSAFIALCLGPDWWNITGTGDVLAALSGVQAAHHVSVVNVSAQRTKLELSGPNARNVLAHHGEQDLRDERFPIGACSQGVLASAPAIIYHCREDCYAIFVRVSFAQHLWLKLSDAAVEYVDSAAAGT